jgi:hypothetical protein
MGRIIVSVTFNPVADSQGLYAAVSVPAQRMSVYWLLLFGPTPPAGPLESSATWASYSGCYIFIPAGETISNISNFVQALKKQFPATDTLGRFVTWIADPNLAPAGVVSFASRILPSSTQAGIGGDSPVPLAPAITLDVPAGSKLGITTDGAGLTLNGSNAGPIQLMRNAIGSNLNAGPITLPLTGVPAGTFLFDAIWNNSDLATFFNDTIGISSNSIMPANEIRFFYETQGTVQSLRYPVFAPVDASQNPLPLYLQVSLDPLNVWDSTRTFFGLDVGKFAAGQVPTATSFFSTDGNICTLVPQQSAGYAFGMRQPVDPSEGPGTYAYLTPCGVFDIQAANNPSATSAGGIQHLMCGLTGTEYLLAASGATIEFMPGNPAHAGTNFTQPAGGTPTVVDPCHAPPHPGGTPMVDGALLNDTYTTSWLQVNPATPQPGVIDHGYAVQPEASVYYSTVQDSGTNTAYPYPLALGCRVSQLADESNAGAIVPVPVAPYGGVWSTGETPTSPAVLQSFESQIIATTRHATAPKDEVNGPTFFDPVAHLGVNGGYAKTPEGLLVQLNTTESLQPGTMGNLLLAKSPNTPPTGFVVNNSAGPYRVGATSITLSGGSEPIVGGDSVSFAGDPNVYAVVSPLVNNVLTLAAPGLKQTLADGAAVTVILSATELSFVGNPVIKPDLSNALMNDNLFMVVTNPTPLGGIATPGGSGFFNEIAVGEWTFKLDVGFTTDQVNYPATILIFKFTTALNVVDLVNNAAYWQDWQTFTDPDPTHPNPSPNIALLQTQINSFLCTAETEVNKDPASVFANFWTKATDPNWTGILGINVGLDVADLPIDIQDLLGGIYGQLRAHHFGVTTNRIHGPDSTAWQIEQSSIFALIHYESDYFAPETKAPTHLPQDFGGFGFQVLKLEVLIENSALTFFNSRLAVTIPQLFKSNVALSNPTAPSFGNVIEIDGTYVKHGDTGTVVFDTTTPQVFEPTSTKLRALSEVYVTDATLVGVSSTTAADGTGNITVLSNFALSGELWFLPDCSGEAAKGLDLFSYGSELTTGLGFGAYNIAMTTVIANSVGQITKMGPDLSQFQVAPSSTPRVGSLLSALPLKLTAFLSGPDSSGWPVTFDGQSTNSFAADFALQFQASLGSLGALSTITDSLEVNLVLGWQAADDSDEDQLWLLMVPPKTMLGQLGFGIEGVLDTTFSNVAVVAETWNNIKVYAIQFANVQIQLLGISLIPHSTGGSRNFTLFADPSQGNASNLGWLMTITVPNKG